MMGFPLQALILLEEAGWKGDTEAMYTLRELLEQSHSPVLSAPPLGKHDPNNP